MNLAKFVLLVALAFGAACLAGWAISGSVNYFAAALVGIGTAIGGFAGLRIVKQKKLAEGNNG